MTSLLIAGMLLFPALSFAQTTTYSPSYIASLKQLLALLEQELITLEAPQTVSSTATSTAPIRTSLVSDSALITTMGKSYPNVTFSIDFNVTSGNQTLDIPDNNVGIGYLFNGINVTDPSSTTTCPRIMVYSQQAYCELPPDTTQEFTTMSVVPTTGEIGTPSMSINQIKYYTDINTIGEGFSYYEPSGLQTSYLSVNQ